MDFQTCGRKLAQGFDMQHFECEIDIKDKDYQPDYSENDTC